MVRAYTSQNAADPSAEVEVPRDVCSTAVMQLLDGGTDQVHVQGTLDGTNWVNLSMENLATGAFGVGTTSNGIYRVNVTGLTAVRLNKTGTTDTITAYLSLVLGS